MWPVVKCIHALSAVKIKKNNCVHSILMYSTHQSRCKLIQVLIMAKFQLVWRFICSIEEVTKRRMASVTSVTWLILDHFIIGQP